MPSKAYASLVIATLLWGGNTVAGKMAAGHVSPMMLNFSRWALAFGLLLVVSLPQLRRDWPVLRAHAPLLLGLGALGYTGFNALLYTGLRHTSAVNGAIEQGAVAVLIFVLNFLLFRVAVSPVQILGFLVSFLGVAITAGHGSLNRLLGLELNLGDAMVMLAVVCYALFTVALRWKPPLHWLSFVTALAAGALVSALPLLAWEGAVGGLILPDATGWALILYCGLLPSLVSQTLYITGVNLIGANRAGLFINLIPVFGTLLSIAIVGERPEPYHGLALALVLAGIALAELGKPKPA